MSLISSINTSDYSKLLEAMPSSNGYTAATETTPVKSASVVPEESVDLSNYYSDVMPGDLLQTVSENVVQSAHDLDNAMVNALQNGYTVQDAVNIQLAKSAYEANCRVAKTTFELSI